MACLLLPTLAACEKPVLSADPAVASKTAGGRPVATLGPDDAIRSATDVTDPASSRATGATTPVPAPVDVAPTQPMESTLRLVNAGQMKQSIDATGKIALQVDFDTGKATLRPDADPLVEQVASLLRDDPGLRLSIEGHTDASGDAAYNRALSRQRAETVRASLIVKGIDADRLQAQGFGADRPEIGSDSEEARERNRRVELVKLD